MAWIPFAAAGGVLNSVGNLLGGPGAAGVAVRAGDAEESARRDRERFERQLRQYEERQQDLMRTLDREVAARAEQDEAHRRDMQEMRETSDRDRIAHQAEMEGYRREAKESEKLMLNERLVDLKREKSRLGRAFDTKMGEAETITLQVGAETFKLQEHFADELEDPSIRRIVLLGLTGDGKSTVANRLVGDTSEYGDQGGPEGGFKASAKTKSETQIVEKVNYEAFGIKISVVDTPGLEDSSGHGRDREHITDLVGYLRGCGGVNQFLITKNHTNPRLSATYQGMLRELENVLGVEFWAFVTVVLTHVEGTRARRQYEGHKAELLREISNLFAECGTLKAVGIGSEESADYEESVEQIITRIVPNEKFMCDSLVSPLETLKDELVELKKECVLAKQEVDAAEEKIRHVEARLTDIEEALRGES